MKKKVFIDGQAGTTGLKINQRLQDRDDLEIMIIPEEDRKNPEVIKKFINESDVTFLCLPDDAAREAVAMVENPSTIIIDTSTAHRVDERFTYGFPEIGNLKEQIKTSKRIANPGCHASGFIALITPLIEKGVIEKNIKLSAFSLTGYSGGGKKMIQDYESEERSFLLDGPRQYGLTQQHKHLKEMVKLSGVDSAPIFVPIVGDFYSGMEVMVPLFKEDCSLDVEGLVKLYQDYYKGDVVKVVQEDEGGFMSSTKLEGLDSMEISVKGNEDRIILTARYDNLGKGASGAAIQNMNLALGLEETKSMKLKR